MRLTPIDIDLVSQEAIDKLRNEIEYKYIANYTNINNIKSMLVGIKKEMQKEGADLKSLEIAMDEQNNLLDTNIKATKLHKKNLIYLNNLK